MNIFQRLSQLISGSEPPKEAPASLPPAERKNAPVVGVSGSKATSKSVIAMMTQLRSAGAEPVFIGDHASRVAGGVDAAVARDLARIDALVVLGNDADIDPAKYGQKAHPATKVEAPERAAYEEAAIQRALEMGMPLTCVCAGMQRLNVIGGGTLNQSLPDTLGNNHHQQHGEHAPFVPV
jgi:gamma-glutamyl-gamma-aminobutyrate hydrolase PuuD